MTDLDLARLWSQYVKELAVLLVRAEGSHAPGEVVERMQELVQRELLLLYMRCGPLIKSHAFMIHNRTRCTGQRVSAVLTCGRMRGHYLVVILLELLLSRDQT
jgi:hypothetical protein